jgi:hypothetical protein
MLERLLKSACSRLACRRCRWVRLQRRVVCCSAAAVTP